MIIYLNKSFSAITAIYLFLFFYLLSNLNIELLYFLDTLNKINLNLFFIDAIYFLWTNLQYLYIYLMPVLCLLSLFSYNSKTSNNFINVSSIFALVCLAGFTPLTNFNFEVHPYSLADNSNLLLSNSINKYHPLLLHWSLNFFFAWYISQNLTTNFHKLPAAVFSTFSLTQYTFFLCTFTMFLGSWWAYQEGSWGGWWAWDPSEVFGLVILLSIIFGFHYGFSSNNYIMENGVFSYICVALALVYLLLQTNFGITSHNFGLSDETDLLLKLSYLAFLFFVISLLVAGSACDLSSLKFLNLTSRFYTNKPNVWLTILLLVIFFNLFTLITDILWNTFYLNILNITINYSLCLNLLSITLLLYYQATLNFNLLSICLLSHLFCVAPYFCTTSIVVYLLLRTKSFSALHSFILCLIVVSAYSEDYYFLNRLYVLNVVDLITSSNAALYTNLSMLSYPFLDEAQISGYSLTNSASASVSSVASMPLFSLSWALSEVNQIFVSDSGSLTFLTSVVDGNSQLVFLLSMFLIITLKLSTRNLYLINS